MNLHSIARRIAIISALALALPGLGAATASAQSDERIDGKYGYVKFVAEDEILRAADIWGDGYRVRAYLHWGRTHSAQVTDKFMTTGDEFKDLAIPERTTVSLTMCYIKKNGDIHRCSDPQRGEA